MSLNKQPAQNNGKSQQSTKRKPTKILPTDRITFARQLDLLRAWAAASGPNAKPVTNKDAADIVKMVENTVTLANPFFVDTGFLRKSDAGFVPAPEVFSLGRAHEWSPDTSAQKLAPIVAASWFAQALMPKLSYGAVEETAATSLLADAANAGPEYRKPLKVLIDYLEAAGLAQRDGSMLKAVRGATIPPPAAPAEPDKPISTMEPEKAPAKPLVSTAYAQPTEGVVQFHVSVRVDMSEFAGWQADRIATFFSGIAQVLAAKGTIEKGSTD